jgi:transcriptional regulator GlxA family with amidase domain
VRKAIRIMQDSFNDRRLSLSDVAQMAGVSDRTLRAAFALHVGASPYQYLLGLRLDAARDRLDKDADGTRTLVRSLANDCGFEHAGRFAKAFAARYGCSPRDYAKRSATKGSRAVGGDY